MNKRMREVPLGALMAAVEIMDADFDSAIPRFESWRPSHPVRSPTYFPATPRNWRGCALFRRWRAARAGYFRQKSGPRR